MEPILKYYERVDTQAVAMQAAVLEEVTYTKVMGTGAKQAFSKAKTATKWMADWIGVRHSIDTAAPPTCPKACGALEPANDVSPQVRH